MRITEFDIAGNQYSIVEAHGHPGRYHINLNRWDEGSRVYEGDCRQASGLSLVEAENYVYDRLRS